MTQIANADAYPMGIAGAGWVARFISAGTSPTTIEDIPSHASHLLIDVSDDAVENVASRLSRCGFQRGISLHTCGAKGPEALTALSHQGVSCGTLHPLQSFPSAEQGVANIAGSAFAIGGDSEAIDWGSAITTLVGGRCLRIPTEDRSLHHAAASRDG